MKFKFLKATVAGLVLTLSTVTNAGVIVDFTEDYELSNWTETLDGGFINSVTDQTVTLTSNNIASGPGATELSIDALFDAMINFAWTYETTDCCILHASWDPFGYVVNGDFTKLTVSNDIMQSGFTSVYVKAGDSFGFSARTVDGRFGAATTTISDFSVVPEPSILAIFALGLMGLVLSRKKQA